MYLSPDNLPLLLAAGIGTGILGAILGTGGGVFLIPLLVLSFGVSMHYAVATSIITVIATSTAVASANVERGTANMRLGMTLEIATSLGAISGGLTVALLAPRFLEGLFAFVMIPTAIMMWRGRKEGGEMIAMADPSPVGIAANHSSVDAKSDSSLGLLGERYYDSMLRSFVSYRVHKLWGGLGISFIAGILSGLLGIGGGVFKVPALHLVCGVPIKAAAATSNFMIGVTATASAFLYYGRGEVRPALTAVVVLGVLVGSAIGSYTNQFVGGRLVNRLFAVLLLGVAVEMMVRSASG
jgi:uncharacterized protein